MYLHIQEPVLRDIGVGEFRINPQRTFLAIHTVVSICEQLLVRAGVLLILRV